MKKFSKIVDVICFVIGPFLTVFSVFSFGYKSRSGAPSVLYYPIESIIGIGIGVALICMGFIRKYWRNKALPDGDKEKENP